MNVQFRQFDGPSDWGWVKSHMPLLRVEDTSGIIAVDLDTNTTVAGCIFDTWTHTSVCAHQIIENPMVLRHGWFEECVDYVYNVCEKQLIIGLVPADNVKALELNAKIGFVELARVPDAVNVGVDLVLLTMTRDQCRFYHPPPPQAATG